MNMFDASVLPMLQALGAASAMLAKAAAHAETEKYDPAILVQARLAPSQFTTAKQIQVMSDFCKTGGALLAGVDSPRMADTEVTFADLQARMDATAAFLGTLTPAQIDGSEGRSIEFKVAGREMKFTGQVYLMQFVLPNVYFHFTTAYSILRHNGVELGKQDFMGALPGMG